MTANQHPTAKRLSFHGFNEEDAARLPAVWSLIKDELPAILDEFYRHLATIDHLRDMIGDPAKIRRLKEAQLNHWMHLFTSGLDHHYFDRAHRIGVAHERVGLEPAWFIGGYNFVLARLTPLFFAKRANHSALLQTLTRALFIDLDIAITVYYWQMQSTAQNLLNGKAEEFEKTVLPMVDGVAASATELSATSESMERSVSQSNQRSASIAAAAEQASQNVQAVAATADELDASLSKVRSRVASATESAKAGEVAAQQTNHEVHRLSEAAEKIGSVVNLISEIASQTNLLALNATIEAARAGEAGKGFAVVAAEVKALANQTSKATDEISVQVANIQETTKDTVVSIENTSTAIDQLRGISSEIEASVEAQSVATGEVSRNVREAADGTRDVSSNVAGLSEINIDAAQASSDVKMAATELSQQAEKLKNNVDEFLVGIRKSAV